MSTTAATPTVSDIIGWAKTPNAPVPLALVTTPVATMTWVAAALRVLPADGTEMHINDVLAGITDGKLRDTTSVKTPLQTLRRDLNVESRRKSAKIVNTRRGFYARKTS